MDLILQEPKWLFLSLLVFLPVLSDNYRPNTYPYLELIGFDPWSSLLSLILRLIAIATMAALILGLAGLQRSEQLQERIAHGANMVLLLDRSNSMDNTFAGHAPQSEHDESKTAAARRLLDEFVQRDAHDRIGIAAYSTSPLFVLPLTENKDALHAAIAASGLPALAYTNISKGLAMALGMFDQASESGNRIVLLISDGAAAIDRDSELAIRAQFKRLNVHLYWIFLRSANSQGIDTEPTDPRDDTPEAMPERHLHHFFQSLNIPYKVYQAENAHAMSDAIADIDHLEQQAIQYFEKLPRQDLSNQCYGLAAFGILLLWLAKLAETKL